MANNLAHLPWILDTAAATPVKQGYVFTTGFVFRNYTGTTTSQAIIKNSYGQTVAVLNGNADGTAVGEAWIVPQAVDGLTLSAIDSGQVEVIVR